jgi:uncharacterized membrane-anchored protein YitT (DUF2179 family)
MNNLFQYIKKEKLVSRFIIFLIGVFILSLNYNMFILPNNFVLGGASGIAVILKSLFGFDPVVSIYVISFGLIIVSFFLLGKKDTRRGLIGSIIYPTAVSLTQGLAAYLSPYFQFENILMVLLIGALLHGLGTGLVYKVGFNTGGGDIIIKLVNKYLHFTEGNSSLIVNTTILLCGFIVLGPTKILYSIMIILVATELIDRIIIGVSSSKMFFIYSKKYKEIEKYIMNELETGVTLFNTEGGFLNKKREMLMAVVSNRDYYRIKEKVLEIDEEAFFVVSDCYEVAGGVRRNNLPFINNI